MPMNNDDKPLKRSHQNYYDSSKRNEFSKRANFWDLMEFETNKRSRKYMLTKSYPDVIIM